MGTFISGLLGVSVACGLWFGRGMSASLSSFKMPRSNVPSSAINFTRLTPHDHTITHTHSTAFMAMTFCSCFASFLGGGSSDGEGKDEAGRPASAAGTSLEMARGRRGSSGSGDNSGSPTTPRVKHELDMKGSQVQVKTTANGCYVVGGKGVVITSLPLEQDCSYWQVKVLKAGRFSMGVSRAADAKTLEGNDEKGPLEWALHVGGGGGDEATKQEEGAGKEAAADATVTAQDGDVFSCVFDQSSFPMLRFYQNGRELEKKAVNRVRGLVFPALQVYGDGAELSFLFHEQDWTHPPPSSRHMMILETRNMI